MNQKEIELTNKSKFDALNEELKMMEIKIAHSKHIYVKHRMDEILSRFLPYLKIKVDNISSKYEPKDNLYYSIVESENSSIQFFYEIIKIDEYIQFKLKEAVVEEKQA